MGTKEGKEGNTKKPLKEACQRRESLMAHKEQICVPEKTNK